MSPKSSNAVSVLECSADSYLVYDPIAKQSRTYKTLAEAEEKARKEKSGLWADKSPEPPWEFRKKERERQKD